MATPNNFWVAVMEIGFVGYLTSLVLLISRGFAPCGEARPRRAKAFCGLAMAFFALWIVGLRQA